MAYRYGFNNPDIVNLTGNIYGNQSIIGGVNINYSNDKVVIGIENFSVAFTKLIDLNDEKKIILKP